MTLRRPVRNFMTLDDEDAIKLLDVYFPDSRISSYLRSCILQQNIEYIEKYEDGYFWPKIRVALSLDHRRNCIEIPSTDENTERLDCQDYIDAGTGNSLRFDNSLLVFDGNNDVNSTFTMSQCFPCVREEEINETKPNTSSSRTDKRDIRCLYSTHSQVRAPDVVAYVIWTYYVDSGWVDSDEVRWLFGKDKAPEAVAEWFNQIFESKKPVYFVDIQGNRRKPRYGIILRNDGRNGTWDHVQLKADTEAKSVQLEPGSWVIHYGRKHPEILKKYTAHEEYHKRDILADLISSIFTKIEFHRSKTLFWIFLFLARDSDTKTAWKIARRANDPLADAYMVHYVFAKLSAFALGEAKVRAIGWKPTNMKDCLRQLQTINYKPAPDPVVYLERYMEYAKGRANEPTYALSAAEILAMMERTKAFQDDHPPTDMPEDDSELELEEYEEFMASEGVYRDDDDEK